jgi:hypothetical protein
MLNKPENYQQVTSMLFIFIGEQNAPFLHKYSFSGFLDFINSI